MRVLGEIVGSASDGFVVDGFAQGASLLSDLGFFVPCAEDLPVSPLVPKACLGAPVFGV